MIHSFLEVMQKIEVGKNKSIPQISITWQNQVSHTVEVYFKKYLEFQNTSKILSFQHVKIIILHIFHANASKSTVYLILRMCIFYLGRWSVITYGQWLPFWTAQIQTVHRFGANSSPFRKNNSTLLRFGQYLLRSCICKTYIYKVQIYDIQIELDTALHCAIKGMVQLMITKKCQMEKNYFPFSNFSTLGNISLKSEKGLFWG